MEVWVMTEIDIQPYSLAVWVDGTQFSNNMPVYKEQGSQKIGGVKGKRSDLRGSAGYSARIGKAAEHGISAAQRSRPLKREQLRMGADLT